MKMNAFELYGQKKMHQGYVKGYIHGFEKEYGEKIFVIKKEIRLKIAKHFKSLGIAEEDIIGPLMINSEDFKAL